MNIKIAVLNGRGRKWNRHNLSENRHTVSEKGFRWKNEKIEKWKTEAISASI